MKKNEADGADSKFRLLYEHAKHAKHANQSRFDHRQMQTFFNSFNF